MFKILFFPVRLVLGFLKLSGVKGGLLLAIGVGIGLLVAPHRGAVMRARLRARIADARSGGMSSADLMPDEDLVL